MSLAVETAAVAVVEDDENSLLVTQQLLRVCGVRRIFGFRSAAEALAGLDGNVDLVLLDVELGSESGFSVLARLRRDPRLARATVVALTSNILPQDVQRARETGFDGFIGKPLNFERFPDQIQSLLEGQAVWQTR